jgi:hypothetical protein
VVVEAGSTVEPSVEVPGAATVVSATEDSEDVSADDDDDWSVLEGAAEF